MINHILVGYDGSDNGARALETAAQMARGLGANLTILHNRLEGPVPERIAELAPRQKSAADSDNLSGFYDAASLHADELKTIGEQLLEEARSAVASYGVTDCELVGTSGNAARAILDHAREHGVDTVVVGSHGHAPLAQWLVGSVSHKIQNAFDGCVVTVR